jgi:hypothetical protein
MNVRVRREDENFNNDEIQHDFVVFASEVAVDMEQDPLVTFPPPVSYLTNNFVSYGIIYTFHFR